MVQLSIDILCMQETRRPKAEVFEHDGHYVVLSGADTSDPTKAGVGFVVAPSHWQRIRTYNQISDRLVLLKLKVRAGSFGILCCYAPHNARPLEERRAFYNSLDAEYRACSANRGKVVASDFNARLGHADAGEGSVIGEHTWGRRALNEVESPNRELLVETCTGLSLKVAHTYFDQPLHEKITFMEAGALPNGDITSDKYNILDFVLCNDAILNSLRCVKSHRGPARATDNFLVTCSLGLRPPAAATAKNRQKQTDALRDPETQKMFAETFLGVVNAFRAPAPSVDEFWQRGELAALDAAGILPERPPEIQKPWISQTYFGPHCTEKQRASQQ